MDRGRGAQQGLMITFAWLGKAALVALMSCKGSDATGQQPGHDEDDCLVQEGGLWLH